MLCIRKPAEIAKSDGIVEHDWLSMYSSCLFSLLGFVEVPLVFKFHQFLVVRRCMLLLICCDLFRLEP